VKTRRPRSSVRRRGFSLVELVVALAMISIVMLATQSAIILAAKAIPDGRSSASNLLTSARAIERLTADLNYATSFLVTSSTQVKFMVPDRNGDGAADTIDYTWAGTGNALMRSYNSAAAVAVSGSLKEFSLVYDKKAAVAATTYSESSEVLLSYFEPNGLLSTDWDVTSTRWSGQCIKPASLPGSATSWRPTRVKFKARYSGLATGQTLVQIRSTSNGGTVPTNNVLAQVTMNESILSSSFQWVEWTISSSVAAQTPGDAIALTFQWVSGTESCSLQYQNLLSLAGDSAFVTTTNSGSSWSQTLTQDLAFYLYGKYTSADPVAYQYRLADVRCALRGGNDNSSRLTATINIPNEPMVSGP